MLSIHGIYKIPSIKNIFFVVSFFDESIHLKKNTPHFSLKWTIKIFCLDDFISFINRLSTDPEHLELLAVNLVKNLQKSLDHCKNIAYVPEDDIIEVFI